jgi:glutamate-ammonia-ligase adenylyltransferase
VNAKYSPGALVDVEYFVQVLQIARGASDPTVRTPSTVRAIAALEAAGRLAPADAELLRSGYRLFRALIDALRVVHGNAKDVTVPPDGSEEFLRLTRRMRRDDPARLRVDLDRTLRQVGDLWVEADRISRDAT